MPVTSPMDERTKLRHLVAGSLANCTAAQVDEVADMITAQRAAGAPSSVWHCAAMVFGTLDRCPCQPCTKARDAAQVRAGLGGINLVE